MRLYAIATLISIALLARAAPKPKPFRPSAADNACAGDAYAIPACGVRIEYLTYPGPR